jgi:hypothetical protein
MSIEEEKDLLKTVELVLKHASDPKAQRTSLRAALRLYYSMGHRNGYNEAMTDAAVGKDKRVVAHVA